jgi:hypothetical protein
MVQMIPLGAGEKVAPVAEKSLSASLALDDRSPKNQSRVSSSPHDAQEIGPSEDSPITKSAIEKARSDLQKSLKEEQMWTKLQMELLVHLYDLNASIAAAESEERMAKLALQQAELIRLQKAMENPQSIPEPEVITVKRRS